MARMRKKITFAKLKRPGLLATTAVTLSACVVGEDFQAPQMAVPDAFAGGSDVSVPDRGLSPWWENFGDKQLNALVRRGMNENLDVQQAMERVIAAQSAASAAGAPNAFDGSLDATAAGGRSTPTVRTASAGLVASWVPDFFGQYRRSQELAGARLDAAYAGVDVARLVYLSSIISAYIDARFFQESLALKRKELESRRFTLESTRTLLAAGSATRLDVLQVEGLVSSTLSDVPLLETGFFRSVHRIATLLGEPAGTLRKELSRGASQPVPRGKAVSGVPADLIRNRPDIRRAENLLAAAVAQTGVRQAQLYPSISILGSIRATAFSSGGSGSSWSFGPAIDIPIFDNGQRKANVEIAESLARERYLAWKSSVLVGIEETENALAAIGRARRAVAASSSTVDSYEKALDLALTSFVVNEATFLEILDSERSLASSRTALAQNRRQLGLDYVALNIAVGGGYNAAVDVKPVRSVADVETSAIPPAPASVGDENATASGIRIVEAEETVFRIALQSGVSVEALAAFNGIEPPYQIYVGQKLLIPPK